MKQLLCRYAYLNSKAFENLRWLNYNGIKEHVSPIHRYFNKIHLAVRQKKHDL